MKKRRFPEAEMPKTRRTGAGWTAISIFSAVVIVLTGLSFARNIVWQNDMRLWDDVLQKNPENARAYVNRGVLRGKARLLDQAIEDLNRAIAIDPDYATAYSNRGIVYALTGQYDKALDDFNLALKLDDALAEALFNRGKTYFIIGRKEFAVADFQNACAFGYENACAILQQMNQGSKAE